MKAFKLILIILISPLLLFAANPTFPQSEINALNQTQISVFGSQIFNSTTMKAVLMHATDDWEIYYSNGSSYIPNMGYSPHNLSYANAFLSSVKANSSGKIMQEFVLHNGEDLNYLFPCDYNAIKVSVIWNNPAGDVEFRPNANQNISLEDDIDLRIIKTDDRIFYPYVFINRYTNSGSVLYGGDNSVDNMEQVFARGEVIVGLRSSSDPLPSNDVALVKISHKGILHSGSKNISIAISGMRDDRLPVNSVNPYPSGCNFARNTIESSNTVAANTYFVAGNSVVLKPGFHVTATTNSSFKATINPILSNKANNVTFRSGTLVEEENTATGIHGIGFDKQSFLSMQIYSLTGVLVYSSTGNFDIQSTNLNDGIYIVEKTNASGNVSREKVILKR